MSKTIVEGLKRKRILGDLRIFQAIHNDLKLSHEIVTTQDGRKRYAYVYEDVDPYEFEDNHFPTITKAFSQEVLKGQIYIASELLMLNPDCQACKANNHAQNERISELKDLLKKEE